MNSNKCKITWTLNCIVFQNKTTSPTRNQKPNYYYKAKLNIELKKKVFENPLISFFFSWLDI